MRQEGENRNRWRAALCVPSKTGDSTRSLHFQTYSFKTGAIHSCARFLASSPQWHHYYQKVIKKIFSPGLYRFPPSPWGSGDKNEFRAPKSLNMLFYYPIAVLHMCHCVLYRIREGSFLPDWSLALSSKTRIISPAEEAHLYLAASLHRTPLRSAWSPHPALTHR